MTIASGIHVQRPASSPHPPSFGRSSPVTIRIGTDSRSKNGNGHHVETDRAGQLTPQRYTCQMCRSDFYPTRPAKYCSAACRQKAYRNRNKQTAQKRRHCQYCRASFTPRNSRHVFCNASCRTMAHRQKRTAAVEAYAATMRVSEDKAHDIIDVGGFRALAAALHTAGIQYSPKLRAWR